MTGFTSKDPDNQLSDKIMDTSYDLEYDSRIMYYNIKRWTQPRGVNNVDGRLLLYTAAAQSLKQKITKQLFEAHKPAIFEMDKLTEISFFMLAAIGSKSDMETMFNLLQKNSGEIFIA